MSFKMSVALANIPKLTGSLSFRVVLEVEREARTCGVWASRPTLWVSTTLLFSLDLLTVYLCSSCLCL